MKKITNPFTLLRFLFVLIIVNSFNASAQNFERVYGNLFEDNATHIVPAFDGGYLLAGYTYDTVDQNEILLVKTDVDGNVQWSKTIGGPNDEQAFWIEKAADSTYLVCGNSTDVGNNKLFDFVIRINLTGAILFQKLYDVNFSERAACVIESGDGGFVVAGETVVGGVDLQMNLFKTDSAGNVEWSKAFGDTEQESASYVKRMPDHGFIISGIARYGLSWSSIFIVKTDSSGNLQWANKYNTSPYFSRCDVSKILETPNGGYLISGCTSGNQPLKSIYLLEIDSLGSVVWQNIYSTGQGERNFDIIQVENGYVLCGSTATATGSDNLLLMKTGATGNLDWQLAYGVQNFNSVANSLVLSDVGKFMVAGYTDAYGAGESDMFLIKSDSVFDGSLCDMKLPGIIQDTITLVQMPIGGSSNINTAAQNVSFSSRTGIIETPVCIQTLNAGAFIQDVRFDISPNPFSDKTTLLFRLPENCLSASLVIYDSFGKAIAHLEEISAASEYIFHIDASQKEYTFSNGIYYLIFSAGTHRTAGKIIFAR